MRAPAHHRAHPRHDNHDHRGRHHTDPDVVDVFQAHGWRQAGPTTWSAGTSAAGGAPVFLIETTAARIRAAGYAITVHIEDDDQAGIIHHPARTRTTV